VPGDVPGYELSDLIVFERVRMFIDHNVRLILTRALFLLFLFVINKMLAVRVRGAP